MPCAAEVILTLLKLTILERIPFLPPAISKVAPDVQRPMLSIMIPVWNCAEYVVETLQSIVSQNFDGISVQIEVIDDFSTDADVAALVARFGNNMVGYYRQPQNVGSLRNFETCIQRATGHYVHIIHGDDRIRPDFYQTILPLFKQYPEAGAAFCAFNLIDPNGNYSGTSHKIENKTGLIGNCLEKMAKRPWLQYVCMVVKRSVYEELGSFCLAAYGEDWEMWVRIAKHYPIAYTPEPLAEYRVHAGSITRRSYLTGDNVRDIARIIQRIGEHLPDNKREEITTEAKKYYAYYALNISYSLWYRTRDKQVVLTQIAEALKMYRDVHLLSKAAMLRGLMYLPQSWLPVLRKAFRPVKAST